MKKLVYYLDDEAELCNVFKDFIENDDIEVVTFVDCYDAVQACAENKPDIIFIDYRLKDHTGNMVAKVLDKDIDKILVTGELNLPEYDLFSLVISKPFSLSEVSQIIEERLK